MVIRLSNDIGHRLWLQGPLNYLSGEVFRRILEFLHI